MTRSSSAAESARTPVDALGGTTIASAIDRLLARRAADASICPSEVARHLEPDDWRRLMQPVRDVAAQLVREGRLQVTQGGQPLSADSPWRGAIRLRRPPDGDSDR